MEVNVQSEGAADAVDSTAAFESANQKCYAAGGGEIIAPSVPNGYILKRLLAGTPYAQKGGGIRLRKGVSLRGEGTKLLLRDNCDFITTAPVIRGTITIIGDVHYGDRNLAVDSTALVATGTRVFLRCGVSGYETAEPRHFGFAGVASIVDGTHLVLDRPVLADMAVSLTPAVNRSLLVFDEVVEGSRIDGFDLINDIPNGGNAESGVNLTMARHMEVSRVAGVNPGAGMVVAQFCDQLRLRQIDCRGSIRQGGQLSKGRVLSLAECTNVEADSISGEAFEGAFLFSEFFNENLNFRTVRIANTFVGRNNAHTALLFNQASAIDLDGLTILGNGSYVVDDGGVGGTHALPATTRVRNLTVRVTPPFTWPGIPVDGYSRIALADKWVAG